jgi:rare lipoprotein A
MPFARTWTRSQLSVFASALVLASFAAPASAGSRAPIKYAYETGTASQAQGQSAPAQSGPVDKAKQRIEFRYPGSPVPAGRVEMASAPTPKAVSPSYETVQTEAPQFAPVPEAPKSRGPIVEATTLQPIVRAAEPVVAQSSSAFFETGVAIVYGDEFAGLPTSNGEIFDQTALTAAHPSLPLPSVVQVTNPATGKNVIVRVNDRGPFEDGASLQVSRQVARVLGFEGAGKAELTVRLVGPAAVDAPKPRTEVKPAATPVLASLTMKPAKQDELLGGDELAGGYSVTAQPRKAVEWPEPPAEWGVRPVEAKVAAAPAGKHFVQLASFSDIGNAETLYRGLQADLPVEIVPARVNGTDYFRVRVGPLASRESAQQLRDRLNAEGKGDGRVVTAE